jgi:hypothetical protein
VKIQRKLSNNFLTIEEHFIISDTSNVLTWIKVISIAWFVWMRCWEKKDCWDLILNSNSSFNRIILLILFIIFIKKLWFFRASIFFLFFVNVQAKEWKTTKPWCDNEKNEITLIKKNKELRRDNMREVWAGNDFFNRTSDRSALRNDETHLHMHVGLMLFWHECDVRRKTFNVYKYKNWVKLKCFQLFHPWRVGKKFVIYNWFVFDSIKI